MSRSRLVWALIGATAATIVGARAGLRASVRGQLTLDLGVGRSVRPLGPITIRVRAPRDVVFDVAAAPYGPNAPRELRRHVEVVQRSSGMVIAAHRTSVGKDVAITVEGVVLDRPDRIGFRVIRGPVPHVVEEFRFDEAEGVTTLIYSGELGTDLWALGRAWGARVAAVWEETVRRSLEQIRDAAEGRARARAAREEGSSAEGDDDPTR
jgi:hypothetical protein